MSVTTRRLARPGRLKPEETLCGNLAIISALDLVQLLCTNRQSWMVRFALGDVEASVTIEAGQLVDARYGTQLGTVALVEILGRRQGQFRLEPIEGNASASLEGGDWRAALLCALQALDERGRSAAEPSAPAPECSREDALPSDPFGEQGQSEAAPESSLTVSGQKVRGSMNPAEVCAIDETAPDSTVTTQPSLLSRAPLFAGVDSAAGRPSLAAFAALIDGSCRLSPDPASSGSMQPARPRRVAAYLTDLGFAALRAGDPAAAKRHWSRALVCDPENRTIALNLRRLEETSSLRDEATR